MGSAIALVVFLLASAGLRLLRGQLQQLQQDLRRDRRRDRRAALALDPEHVAAVRRRVRRRDSSADASSRPASRPRRPSSCRRGIRSRATSCRPRRKRTSAAAANSGRNSPSRTGRMPVPAPPTGVPVPRSRTPVPPAETGGEAPHRLGPAAPAVLHPVNHKAGASRRPPFARPVFPAPPGLWEPACARRPPSLRRSGAAASHACSRRERLLASHARAARCCAGPKPLPAPGVAGCTGWTHRWGRR